MGAGQTDSFRNEYLETRDKSRMKNTPPEKIEDAEAVWRIVVEKRNAAVRLFELGFFSDSLSRAYYAAFHAVTLLFYLRDQEFTSHKNLKGAFNKLFIHPGFIPVETGKAFEALYNYRQAGDYDVRIQLEKEEVRKGLESLDTILKIISN